MITLPFRLNLLLPVFCLLLFTLDTVEAIEAFFEDVIALEMPKREAGYRGMMGDVVELNDGRADWKWFADKRVGIPPG